MTRRVTFAIAWIVLLATVHSHRAESLQTGTPPEAIFYNGHFVTMNAAASTA